MRRIALYRKEFDATSTTTLKELKSTYRGLVKEWHPDKFANDPEKLAEAEIKSQKVIDAYHFLVSLAPETKEAGKAAYDNTIATCDMEDFSYEKQVLEVFFSDGSSYEYFGVKESVYKKLCNSATQMRFCKRHVFNSLLFRKTEKKQSEE
jgi:curved DNA-binding protein CbpA